MKRVTMFHMVGKEVLVSEGTDHIYVCKSGAVGGFRRDDSLMETIIVPIRQFTNFTRSSCRTIGDILYHEPTQYDREDSYVGLNYSDCDVFSSLLEEEFEERAVGLRATIKDLEIKNQSLREECEMLRTQLGRGLLHRCKSRITYLYNWCVHKCRYK